MIPKKYKVFPYMRKDGDTGWVLKKRFFLFFYTIFCYRIEPRTYYYSEVGIYKVYDSKESAQAACDNMNGD